MAVSDQLRRLANRAEEAEKNAAAARDMAKADLEQDRETLAQSLSKRLNSSARRPKAQAGGRSPTGGTTFKEAGTSTSLEIQKNVESKKAEIDLDRAKERADNAEADAEFAIEFAYTAIGEAEYAVLDANLARKEADELSGVSA